MMVKCCLSKKPLAGMAEMPNGSWCTGHVAWSKVASQRREFVGIHLGVIAYASMDAS